MAMLSGGAGAAPSSSPPPWPYPPWITDAPQCVRPGPVGQWRPSSPPGQDRLDAPSTRISFSRDIWPTKNRKFSYADILLKQQMAGAGCGQWVWQPDPPQWPPRQGGEDCHQGGASRAPARRTRRSSAPRLIRDFLRKIIKGRVLSRVPDHRATIRINLCC